ncbi:hypothetical protein HK100_010849, partial [Physocladia obscura]
MTKLLLDDLASCNEEGQEEPDTPTLLKVHNIKIFERFIEELKKCKVANKPYLIICLKKET